MGAPVCHCVKISQNLPASHNFHFPAKNRRDNLSNWRNFIYESNRNCAPHRRPRPRRYSQGNPKNHAYPRGRPVTDNIGTVGKILLRYVGSVKKMGTGLYIVTEDKGETVGIREGWNGGKRLRNIRRLDAARQAFLLFTSICSNISCCPSCADALQRTGLDHADTVSE